MRPIFKGVIWMGLLLCLSEASAQEPDIWEDLGIRFLTVSIDGQPQTIEDPGEVRSLGFFVRKSEAFSYISLDSDSPFYLWIDGRMYYSNLDSLTISKEALFGETISERVFLSVSSRHSLAKLSARMYYGSLAPLSIAYPIGERIRNAHQNFMVMATLILLLSVGGMHYFSSQSLLSTINFRPVRDLASGTLGGMNSSLLFRVLILAILAGFAIWNLQDHEQESERMLDTLASWAVYSLVVGAGLMFKYYLIRLVSGLYGIKRIVDLQFNDFIHFGIAATLLFDGVLLVRYWVNYYSFSGLGVIWEYYFLIVQVAFLIYFLIKVAGNIPVKKLSIISYLCTTEILGAYLIALIFAK